MDAFWTTRVTLVGTNFPEAVPAGIRCLWAKVFDNKMDNSGQRTKANFMKLPVISLQFNINIVKWIWQLFELHYGSLKCYFIQTKLNGKNVSSSSKRFPERSSPLCNLTVAFNVFNCHISSASPLNDLWNGAHHLTKEPHTYQVPPSIA